MKFLTFPGRSPWLGSLWLGLVLALTGTSAGRAAGAAESLRVLFLGDQGHHRPADRFKELQPVLAGRGIELVYTERLDDLHPTKLAGFDCLAIYANHPRLSPAQEQAMLDFVA